MQENIRTSFVSSKQKGPEADTNKDSKGYATIEGTRVVREEM